MVARAQSLELLLPPELTPKVEAVADDLRQAADVLEAAPVLVAALVRVIDELRLVRASIFFNGPEHLAPVAIEIDAAISILIGALDRVDPAWAEVGHERSDGGRP